MIQTFKIRNATISFWNRKIDYISAELDDQVFDTIQTLGRGRYIKYDHLQRVVATFKFNGIKLNLWQR